MYLKLGDINLLRFLFDVMFFRICVFWIVMISGYVEKGDMDEVLVLFYVMNKIGVSLDLVILFFFILGCGRFGLLEIGRWVDVRVDIYGFKRDNVMVCNVFIDMYLKCGSVIEV